MPQGNGIRGSKDLRARARKFLILTNERKQMSTMTLRKRISLVAVSALSVGLLSVVTPQAANAAATDAPNVTANVTTGVALASAANTAGSVGLLAESGENTTQTAVLLASGAINVFLAAPASGSTATATITGGQFTAVHNGGSITGTSGTSANAVTSATALGLVAKPNSGSTKMVINLYSTAGGATPVDTLSARVTVTVVATSVYNTYSPTYSWARWGAGDGAETATTDATANNYTTTTGLRLTGSVQLVDAYGNPLTSANTGLLTATVTAGAKVNLGSASADGSTTFDSNSTTAGASATGSIPFNIIQSDSDVPWNGTLTISFDGTVIATKTATITGEVAKVTLSTPKIGTIGGANVESALIAYEDAKGNAVYPTSGTSAVSASLGAVVTGMTVGTYPIVGTTGKISTTCATSGSATGLQMQHLNGSGTIILSNKWDSGCSSTPYTVTGSWDKASYTPGSIATLTLSFKDIFGNKSNAYDSISVSGANTTMTITGAPATAPVTAIGNDKPSGVTGDKTYQFVVGSTEGDFVAIVVPTEVTENNSKQANLSLAYSVKAGTASVSNADVLKSIVALIASINKQIQALQKLILKR